MCDNLEDLTSLPPSIQGKVHGLLKAEIGKVVWVSEGLDPSGIMLRLKFWGEKSPGKILKPASSSNSALSSVALYSVKCTQPIFVNYLNDMGVLNLDIMDSNWRLLGNIKINLKLYFRRDQSLAKGNLASNFGFSNLEVAGAFPILGSEEPKKLGEIELKIYTDFVNWNKQRSSKEVLASFQANELKAHFETLPDTRVPKSLLDKTSEEYSPEPQPQQYKPQPHKVTFESQSSEPQKVPQKHTPEDTPTFSTEWAKLKERGELLRNKLEISDEEEEPYIPEEPKPLPTISEIEALQLPMDPTDKPVKEKTPRPYSDLTSVTHLKLSISTLTLMCDSKLVENKNIHLDCGVPVPSTHQSKLTLHTDSFKVHYKGACENIYEFKHESWHHLGLSEGAFAKLGSSTIKFRLMGTEPKGRAQELAKSEVIWEKVLLSPAFAYSAVLEMVGELPKNPKAKKQPLPQVIARLNVNFELISQDKKQTEKTEKPQTPVEQELLPQVEPEYKSFQLYLYIDSGCHFAKAPNLYVSYKTFPDPERITTPVLWDYQDNFPINHKMQIPLTANQHIISKLYSASIILEVWDKPGPSKDELLGLVKLPLALFGTALASGSAAFTNSVYPLIAFDEYRAVHNLRTGEDVGYLRVCLALGSASQVHRLHLSHSQAVRPEVSYKKKPEMQNTSVGVSIDNAQKPVEEEVEEPTEPFKEPFKEPIDQTQKPTTPFPTKQEYEFATESKKNLVDDFEEEWKKPHINESMESIGDIANWLNAKPKQPEQKPSEPKSRGQVLEEFKQALEREQVNLDEELKLADKYNHGAMSSESLSHLLNDLQLNISPEDIQSFIDIVLSETASNKRRVKIEDILVTLGIEPPKVSNTKHSFSVTVVDLFNCSALFKLAPNSTYVKMQFPYEDNFVESDLIEPGSNIKLNMKSVHSCTLPNGSGLAEVFTGKTDGIVVQLCRNVARFQEKILGKGLLPIEEIMDLEHSNKLTRVICLYGDRTECLQNYGSEIIGKLRITVEYSHSYTYEDVGRSAELLYERQTEVDRMIPRNNALNMLIENCAELNRAKKYFDSLGIYLDSNWEVSASINPFGEDEQLSKTYPEVKSAKAKFEQTVSLGARDHIQLSINDNILDYLKNKSAVVHLTASHPYQEEILIGTARVNLTPLLLQSLVSGEFPLLNDYGQFMGYISLRMSFMLEDNYPTQVPHKHTQEASTSPIQSAKHSPELPGSPKNSVLNPPPPEPDSVTVHFTIESALHIPKVDGLPNPYVQLAWNSQVVKTPPVLRTTCPAWSCTHSLCLTEALMKPLTLEIWHKSLNDEDIKMGEAEVDLGALWRVSQIDGWYHIYSGGKESGQIKIRVVPIEDLYEKFTGKPRKFDATVTKIEAATKTEPKRTSKLMKHYEERIKVLDKSLADENEEDILQKHIENMKHLEDLSRKLGNWFEEKGSPKRNSPERSAVFRSTSPLRRSQELTYKHSEGPLISEEFHQTYKPESEESVFKETYKPEPAFEEPCLSYQMHKPEPEPAFEEPRLSYQMHKPEPEPAFEEPFPSYHKPYEFESPVKENQEEDWDSSRIDEVLKTIQEAQSLVPDEEPVGLEYPEETKTEFYRPSESYSIPVPLSQSFTEIETPHFSGFEKQDTSLDQLNESMSSSKLRASTSEKGSPKRSGELKVGMLTPSRSYKRPPLPKALLKDPEISRIAAIMKGKK